MAEEKTRDWYINKAIEMSVREASGSIRNARDAFEILKPFGLKEQEHFIILNLNTANEVISQNVVSIGTVNRTIVHPREVFRKAIEENATAIFICHNHPSGSMKPSEEDKQITERLRDAGEILGISVIDHLIVSKDSYFSFDEAGI